MNASVVSERAGKSWEKSILNCTMSQIAPIVMPSSQSQTRLGPCFQGPSTDAVGCYCWFIPGLHGHSGKQRGRSTAIYIGHDYKVCNVADYQRLAHGRSSAASQNCYVHVLAPRMLLNSAVLFIRSLLPSPQCLCILFAS